MVLFLVCEGSDDLLNAPLETKPRVLHLKNLPASSVRGARTADIYFLFSIPPLHNMLINRLPAKRARSTYLPVAV